MSEKLVPSTTNPEISGANIHDTSEFQDDRSEAYDAAVAALGSAFHEDWRKTRLNDDGSFEPRVKTTADESWIEANGTDQVDIANTDYEGLPEDWKGENKAAAGVIVGIIDEHNGAIDLSDPLTRSQVGARVHDEWLVRNDWAKGSELDVPFDELTAEEQAKDLSQVEVALNLFEA